VSSAVTVRFVAASESERPVYREIAPHPRLREFVEAIARDLRGADVVVPRRTTFYGADEIGVRVPGGHVVVFAQMRG